MGESQTSVMNENDVRNPQEAQAFLETGSKAEQAGDRMAAIEAFEKAFAADPENAQVCFRLAYNLDLVGEEEEALHLYEQVCEQANPPLNALVNLAVAYEDRGEYAKAERCIQQVLATEPNHPRANLFIKDIRASKAMTVIDEAREKRMEKFHALLDTPVTDFDLSVKTRNALRKMNIRTLADLLRTTESELRSYKLPEDSIHEVKSMLAQRGLRLGQALEEQQSVAKQAVYDQMQSESADNDLLSRSVNELDLSVRARKALALLNVKTVGDLVVRTEAELMGIKNFGSTSLNEIKAKIADLGLSLRTLGE